MGEHTSSYGASFHVAVGNQGVLIQCWSQARDCFFLRPKPNLTTQLVLMPFGEIVCGSPGSGKSTYCFGKYQIFTALNRPISVASVNVDPATSNLIDNLTSRPWSLWGILSINMAWDPTVDYYIAWKNDGISWSQLWLVGRMAKRTGSRCLCVWSAWPSRTESEPWKGREKTDKKCISGVLKYPLSLLRVVFMLEFPINNPLVGCLCDAHYIIDATKCLRPPSIPSCHAGTRIAAYQYLI